MRGIGSSTSGPVSEVPGVSVAGSLVHRARLCRGSRESQSDTRTSHRRCAERGCGWDRIDCNASTRIRGVPGGVRDRKRCIVSSWVEVGVGSSWCVSGRTGSRPDKESVDNDIVACHTG